MKTSETVAKLYPALLEAQKKIKNIGRDAKNPFFKSTYATLPAVLDVVRPILNENGLVLIQAAEIKEKSPLVVTRIVHTSGEWIETEASSGSEEIGPQKYGSAITYLRRYSIMALCGVSAEADDDGNLAQEKSGETGKGGKEITIQEKIDKLPVDLKDLMAKAGCNTLQQKLQLLNSKAWNLVEVRKVCLEEIKKRTNA